MRKVTMQKRHFEFIAATIRALRTEPAPCQATLDMVAREFGRVLKQTNPLFNAERFERATQACDFVFKNQRCGLAAGHSGGHIS